jgi:hypothetical protein
MARTALRSKSMTAGARAGVAPAAVIAVMSHHATFAMQMRRAGFEVAESRDIDAFTASLPTADLVVADLVAVEGKRGLVARLRSAVDERVPIVLISADEVDVALLGPGRTVHVVVPPVRADYLVARVRQILKALPAPAQPEETAPEGSQDAAAERSDGETPTNVTPMRGRERTRRTKRNGSAPGPASGEGDVTAKSESESPGAAEAVVDLSTWEPPVPDWRVMAHQLATAVRGVPAVSSVAQVMAEELATTAGADVVVMVRDLSGTWQVEGGAGLRSFEWAQVLEDDDWIVDTGREQYASLLVADTDAVRGVLVGAPLASRHQLARTHSTIAPFMVCAAWGSPGDDQERVALVVSVLRRHEAAMTDAMVLRDHVRTLVRQVERNDG